MGQLFVVPLCPELGEEHIESVCNLLSEQEIGGVLFSNGNGEKQLLLNQRFASLSSPPLIFQDAEWGVGMRLSDVFPLPKNMTLAATGDIELMKAYGIELAHQCRSYGVDVNFAPVCDVNRNPQNPIIGIRSLGDDPEQVGKMAGAIYQGMRAGGLFGCAKHFPGHGNTHIDSHFNLPIIDTLDTEPFAHLINAGVELVMMGHLLCPEVDPLPSSLSKTHMQGILRQELGFEGVVVTDALNMQALEAYGSLGERCERALLSGSDLLLFASIEPDYLKWLIEKGIPEAIAHLKETIPQELIDLKLDRIDGLRKRELPPIPEANPALAREIFRRAITPFGTIPQMGSEITLVRNGEDRTFERALSLYAEVRVVSGEMLDPSDPFIVVEQVEGNRFENLPDHAVVCLFDVPYALHHPHALIAYEPHRLAKEAVADCLYGNLTPFGKLPIQLCQEFGGEYGRSSGT